MGGSLVVDECRVVGAGGGGNTVPFCVCNSEQMLNASRHERVWEVQ